MLSRQATDLITVLARDRNAALGRMADRAIGMAGFIDREIKKGSEILIKRADGSMVRVVDI
jgi:hypothetical protein